MFYFFADHLGSSRVVTNATGDIVEDSDFYPFGGERVITDSLDNNYKFTSKERDAESGLDYFGARYYGSSMGRFSSPDPKGISLRHLLNPQKLNKYSYVLNNPLGFVDPNGLEEVTVTVRAFIPQEKVGSPVGFRGDNRSFSSKPDASSRVSITFKIETDPAKRGSSNPMIGTPSTTVSSTKLDIAGKVVAESTSTGPNPPHAVSAYDSRNQTTNIVVTMDMANPQTPGVQGIRTDLNITIPQDASTISISGTVSGSPAFEVNVTTENGKTTNIPIQNAPSNAAVFVVALEQTNTVNKQEPLKEKEREVKK